MATMHSINNVCSFVYNVLYINMYNHLIVNTWKYDKSNKCFRKVLKMLKVHTNI